jgi:hypothetical protein
LHNVRVVATAANGYAAATNYAVALSAGTVDGVSVAGAVVGHFSIEARSALRPLVAGLPLDVSVSGAVGSVTGAVGSVTGAVGSVTGAVGSVTADVTLAAAEENAIADAVRARQLTEGYAADGVAPTLQQALFMIQQMLTEMSISGTTMTVKKIDGATTAATFTLDDATTPTSITRAT